MKLKVVLLALVALIPLNGIAIASIADKASLNPLDLLKIGLEANLSFEQVGKIKEHIPDFFDKGFSAEDVLKACGKAHEFIPRLLAKDLYADLINQVLEKEKAAQKFMLYTAAGVITIVAGYMLTKQAIKYWTMPKTETQKQ